MRASSSVKHFGDKFHRVAHMHPAGGKLVKIILVRARQLVQVVLSDLDIMFIDIAPLGRENTHGFSKCLFVDSDYFVVVTVTEAIKKCLSGFSRCASLRRLVAYSELL